MSAIFGIIDFWGRPLKDGWIRSMQADLAHRGPDGQGLYREESVVLGHMLLQVTPESVYDKSPYEEAGFIITANARLDEREAIMDRLGITGECRKNITDPLLLLRSFIKFGKDFVKDIYGDFAFAIWDKNKKELFCARDHIGVKPFIYYFKEGVFVFSTEIKSIVRLPFVEKTQNINRFDTVIFGSSDKTFETAWEGIMRLPSATDATVSKDKFEFNKYWLPCISRNRRLKEEGESVNQLLAILRRIIKDHTRCVYNVGIPLSGGLDSSTIACITSEVLSEIRHKIITVSEILEPGTNRDEFVDEKEYILAVLDQIGDANSIFVYHKDFQYFKNLHQKFERNFDVFSAAYFVDDSLFQSLKEKNTRRVLSGFLGDTTISNSTIKPLPYLLVHFKFGRLFRLINSVRRATGQSLFKVTKGLFADLFSRQLFWIRNIKISHAQQIVSMHGIFKWSTSKCYKILKEHVNTLFPSQLSNRSLVKLIHNHKVEIFEENWDCTSSHYGLEITYPFLDRRLIEFLCTIPPEHFMAGGMKRGLIRMAMKGILPEKVRLRTTKGAYSPNFHQIFKGDFDSLVELLKNRDTVNKLTTEINLDRFSVIIETLKNKSSISELKINYWNFVYLCIWIVYSDWVNNLQNEQDISKKDLE